MEWVKSSTIAFIVSFILFILVKNGIIENLTGNHGMFSGLYVLEYLLFLWPLTAIVASAIVFICSKGKNKRKLFFITFFMTLLFHGLFFGLLGTLNQSQVEADIKASFDYCETDSDCVAVLWTCGSCSDYTMAVNREHQNEYSDIYNRRCANDLRSCDSMPSGTAKCSLNSCMLDAE